MEDRSEGPSWQAAAVAAVVVAALLAGMYFGRRASRAQPGLNNKERETTWETR